MSPLARSVESLESRQLLSGGPFHGLGNADFTAVADFNGDNKADMVGVENVQVRLGKNKIQATSVVAQLGKGNGFFVASDADVLPGKVGAVVAADFNNDGNADIGLLSADSTGNTTLQVLAGDGTGKFAAPQSQSVGQLPLSNLIAGNINDDGYADLLSWDGNSLYTAISDPDTGLLTPAFPQDFPNGVAPLGAGDLDGDGRIDLVSDSNGQLLITKSVAATGEFLAFFLPAVQSPLPAGTQRVAVGDVNGDGANDIAALGDGWVSIALQTIPTPVGASLAFGEFVTTNADISPKKTVLADVDGDGKADLFRPGHHFFLFSRAKSVLISNGDGTFDRLFKLGFGNCDRD